MKFNFMGKEQDGVLWLCIIFLSGVLIYFGIFIEAVIALTIITSVLYVISTLINKLIKG